MSDEKSETLCEGGCGHALGGSLSYCGGGTKCGCIPAPRPASGTLTREKLVQIVPHEWDGERRKILAHDASQRAALAAKDEEIKRLNNDAHVSMLLLAYEQARAEKMEKALREIAEMSCNCDGPRVLKDKSHFTGCWSEITDIARAALAGEEGEK